jgi:hypothetical protein
VDARAGAPDEVLVLAAILSILSALGALDEDEVGDGFPGFMGAAAALDPEAFKDFLASIDRRHRGSGRAHSGDGASLGLPAKEALA